MTKSDQFVAEACSVLDPRERRRIDKVVLEIRFPDNDNLRARPIVSRSRARSTGKYPSWKNGRMIQFESWNELNTFRTLDCDPLVLRFTEQPCEITYLDAGHSRRHFPDVLVTFADRQELWEIKADRESTDAEILRRTALLQDLSNWGYGYQLVPGGDAARQPRLGNCLRLLQLGSHREVSDSEREGIRRQLRDKGALQWGEACCNLYGTYGRAILCRLALEGQLVFDLEARWTEASTFSAKGTG